MTFDNVKYILYFSRCLASEFSRSDIGILAASRANNHQFGLTGFLHRENGHYFQYIEGASASVDMIFARIGKDPRHFAMKTLASGSSTQRRFPGWSMGYSDEWTAAFDPNQAIDPARIVVEDLVSFMIDRCMSHMNLYGD
jgi:hypothetical protein